MSYGSPASMDEVENYYTHIRGGKRPSKEEIDSLKLKYAAIGGLSPLLRITHSIAYKLQKVVDATATKSKVYYAMKHSSPFISDVIKMMYAEGVKDVLCIALAPHYSSMSVGEYMKVAFEANEKIGGPLQLEYVPSWYSHNLFISVWKKRISELLNRLPDNAIVIFTAHSLPARILQIGDPYQAELRDMVKLLTAQLGIRRWSFAYQSAGHTAEKWLGPKLLEVLENLASNGQKIFAIAPIGFVTEHLEILYDLDIECVEWAKSRNVKLERTELPNDSDDFINFLYSLVKERGYA